MDRRDFLKYAGATAVVASLPGCVSVQKRKRSHTNFVVIFTDDQGYADVGCYGAKGFATPNLDQMAKDGVRFSDFYVSQAVCSASRAALMTGCYSNRVSILGALFPDDNYGLNPQEDTIAGAPLPEKKIDGVNILPLLERKNENPRDVFYFYYGEALQAVRQGRWKLHFPHSYRSYEGDEPGKDGYPGKRTQKETTLELYDLKNDISERNNVIDQHRDIAKRLEALAEEMRGELGDNLTKRIGREIRPAGEL